MFHRIAPVGVCSRDRATAPRIVPALGAVLYAAFGHAVAQTDGTGQIEGPPSFLVLGAGASAEYEGADTLRPVPLVVARTRIAGNLLEITGTQARLDLVGDGRLLAGPVIGFTTGRDDAVGDDRIARFEELDLSFEPGGFAAWRAPLGTLDEGLFEIGATLTSSVGGDWEGTKLGVGVDYSWAATGIFRLAVGASVSVVDDDYADSRFGVSAADSAASGLAPYDPSGGVKDAAVSLRSILSFSPTYGIFTRAAYTRLLDDAADSPIVDVAGSADQVFFGAGLFVSFAR